METVDEELEKTINKDINRTLIYTYKTGVNEMSLLDFKKEKRNKLFNILKAYGIYDADVNYFQGTNYIVAVLLNSINSERACFWTFVRIMNDKHWRDLCTNNTPKLLRMLDLLKNNIQKDISDLYEYFESINVRISLNIYDQFIDYFSAVFTQYFVTLFSYNCPIEYTNRVIDLFWLNEEKIIIDCLLHLMKLQKEVLMKMQMDELIPYIRDKIVIDTINVYGLHRSLPF